VRDHDPAFLSREVQQSRIRSSPQASAHDIEDINGWLAK
jgi:hypothetical protein